MPAASLAMFALLATSAPPVDVAAAALPVRGGGWHGSAVVWDRQAGLLLTALHVVEEMPRIDVRLPNGAFVAARIVDRDLMLDLALIEATGAVLPPALPTATARPAEGQPVWVAACPSLACGATAGEVTAPIRAFAGSSYLEIRADAAPGASGGGVVDAAGALVGIADLTLRRRPGVALAIPVNRALQRFPRPIVAAAGDGGAAPRRALQ